MKISTRLILGFCACLVFILVLGGIGIYAVKSVATKGNQVIEGDAKIVENAHRLRANTNMLRRFEKDTFINISDPAKVDEYIKKWEDVRGHAAKRMETLLQLETEPKDKELLDGLNKALESYGSGFLKVTAQIKSGAITSTQDANKAIGEYKEATHLIEKSIVDYATTNDKNITKAKEALKADVQRTVLFLSVIVVASFVVVLVLVIILIRSITGPTRKLLETATIIESGDLTARCHLEGNDEMAQIAGSFDRVAATFTSSINALSGIAADVTAAASKVHMSSEEMAAGSERVASEAVTVATAGEEMAATSGDIASNCQMAADSAHQASGQATDGAAIIQNSINVMEKIAERVRDTARTVESLGQRSDQIGQIIGTIEDIADQTNLLALNAAIEAARAGEMGRGFAVVADEVRALAERTTKATKEIGAMIKAIQQETRAAVGAMEEGVEQVQQGSHEASRSGDAIEGILDQINSLSMQINQIATAAEEQTATTSEISGNMMRITESVNQSSSNAQESALEASHLNEYADALLANLNKFIVEESVNLSLKKAKSAHMIFTGKIRAHLSGATRLDPNNLSTHLNCAFGKWCQSSGKQSCGHLPIFSEIEGPHAKVHDLGKQAVQAYNSGDKNRANDLSNEMLANSDKLLAILDRMMGESVSLMQWGPQFSINVQQFDNQHKRLIEMVNQLNDAMNSGKGHDALKSILDGLIQYTATHFADEEKILAQQNFPDLEQHKLAHKELVKTALELQKKFHGSSSALSGEVMNFLRNWLVNHIQGVDKKYGVYLNGKGIN